MDDDDDWEVSPDFVEAMSKKYEINDIPLFADELPTDMSEKPAFEALQSLKYDDETPETLALQFKESGNEHLRNGRKHHKDALICYTNGIEANCSNQTLTSQLYSNRAYVYLVQGEYVKCIDDCRAAVNADSRNLKAYIRGAKASLKLDLYQQCVDFSTTALEVDGSNKESQELMRIGKERLETLETKKAELSASQSNITQNLEELNQIVSKRGIRITEGVYNFPENLKATLYADAASLLHWPVIFLIDEYNVAEFIRDFLETNTLADYMKDLFSGDTGYADWDEKREYKWDNLSVYYEPNTGNNIIYEIPRNVELSDLLSYVKLASDPLTFHIVPCKSKIKDWLISSHSVIVVPTSS